jgi:hypothetical protein
MLRNNHPKHDGDGLRACERWQDARTTPTGFIIMQPAQLTNIYHSCFPLADSNNFGEGPTSQVPGPRSERCHIHASYKTLYWFEVPLAHPWSPGNEEHGRESTTLLGHGKNWTISWCPWTEKRFPRVRGLGPSRDPAAISPCDRLGAELCGGGHVDIERPLTSHHHCGITMFWPVEMVEPKLSKWT